MKTDTLRGASYPQAEDSILDSLEGMVRTTGSIVTVDSVAAARTTLSAAEWTPTPQYPAYFDIQGIIYRADGSKTGSAWVLSPVNPNGLYRSVNSWSGKKTLTNGQRINLSIPSIPVAYYDRGVEAVGMSYGANSTGVVHLGILIQGTDLAQARFDNGDNSSATCINSGTIPAGADPSIILCLMGGAPSGGSIELLSDTTMNRFLVRTYPLPMG